MEGAATTACNHLFGNKTMIESGFRWVFNPSVHFPSFKILYPPATTPADGVLTEISHWLSSYYGAPVPLELEYMTNPPGRSPLTLGGI